jgi:YfiH family protein
VSDFEFRSADGITYVVCVPFEQAGFTAAFSTRDGAREGEPVSSTAGRLLGALGASGMTVATCRQIHSSTVRAIDTDADAANDAVEADAMVTKRPGVLLGVKTADCVPVLIADTRTRAVAAVHAGWRGITGRIVERTFARLMGGFGTRGADCIAAIGPAICASCFEVGAEVVATFRDEFPYADRLISNVHDEKGHIDLKLASQIQLELCGVPVESISVTTACTMCETDKYFSYRREGARAGRILSVVGARA